MRQSTARWDRAVLHTLKDLSRERRRKPPDYKKLPATIQNPLCGGEHKIQSKKHTSARVFGPHRCVLHICEWNAPLLIEALPAHSRHNTNGDMMYTRLAGNTCRLGKSGAVKMEYRPCTGEGTRRVPGTHAASRPGPCLGSESALSAV